MDLCISQNDDRSLLHFVWSMSMSMSVQFFVWEMHDSALVFGARLEKISKNQLNIY